MEVAPHHLLLDSEMPLGALGKVNPPLRSREHRMGLMSLFHREDVVIATDHAPHTIDEKEKCFEDSPPGIPGVEERLPLLMALAKRGDVNLEKVVRACCEKPASLLGLPKGRIAEGCDADLAVYDPREMKKISGPGQSRCGWTPYEGFEAIHPSYVFLRGEMLVERGVVVGSRGQGRYVGHARTPEAREA